MAYPTPHHAADPVLAEHRALVIRLAASFDDTGVLFEELVDVGLPALVRAARTFDPARGTQFSTYAHTLIQNAMRFFLMRRHPDLANLSLDEPLGSPDEHETRGDLVADPSGDPYDHLVDRLTLEDAVARLAPEEATLLRRLYGFGVPRASARSLAHEAQVPVAAITARHRRALIHLRWIFFGADARPTDAPWLAVVPPSGAR